jgi:hypothetical protein
MKALIVSAILTASAAMAVHADAAEGRWCAIYGNAEGGKNCYFATHRQCMADLSGKGGWCQRNTGYGGARYLRY